MASGNRLSNLDRGIQNHKSLRGRLKQGEYLRMTFDEIQKRYSTGHIPYLWPDESHPLRSRPIIARAPVGVYVGVGTERCLFAAVMNKNFTHIVMADHDRLVNNYNIINLALIRASPDMKTCNDLRGAKTFEDFRRILDSTGYTIKGINLRDPIYFDFLNTAIRKNKSLRYRLLITSGFKTYHRGSGDFSKISYLHNKEAFDRIKEFLNGDYDRIVVRHCDFGNGSHLNKLSRELNEAGLKISMLDLSNAWHNEYISKKQSGNRNFVLGLSPAFHRDGIVIISDLSFKKFWEWYYIGFRHHQLVEHGEDGLIKRTFTGGFHSMNCKLGKGKKNTLVNLPKNNPGTKSKESTKRKAYSRDSYA